MYAITECYQWYKGADATHWGVYKTLESAKEHLRKIIEERFDYMKDNLLIDDEDEDGIKEWNEWIDSRFIPENDGDVIWVDEDDDAVTKFYIEETEVED